MPEYLVTADKDQCSRDWLRTFILSCSSASGITNRSTAEINPLFLPERSSQKSLSFSFLSLRVCLSLLFPPASRLLIFLLYSLPLLLSSVHLSLLADCVATVGCGVGASMAYQSSPPPLLLLRHPTPPLLPLHSGSCAERIHPGKEAD